MAYKVYNNAQAFFNANPLETKTKSSKGEVLRLAA